MHRIGINVISPIDNDLPWPNALNLIQAAHFNTIKFHMPFETDPIHVEQAIQRGIKTVILRTDDGLKGYQYQAVQALFEQPGGIGHFSYADLLKRYPDVEFWLEIGNEPNMAYIDGWTARWWALACIKELKLNFVGHIDEPWSKKYPGLKWSVCLPTNYQQAKDMMTYLDNHGKDDIGDGSIIDYYDAINCHLYGDYQVLSYNYDWPKIFDMLVENKYVERIHVTEMGINDPSTPIITKCRRYHSWIASANGKVDICCPWYLGRGDDRFTNYEINTIAALTALVNG